MTRAVPWTVLSALLAAWLAPGCTAEQAYSSGQAWQRNECNKLLDKAEYDRCMRRAETSYESYRRETESAR